MLDEQSVQVEEERSSRKQPLSDADARALLRGKRTVIVARGSKVVSLGAQAAPDDLKGPSGGYRAPLVAKGKTLLVGFNEAALRNLISG